MKKQMRQGVFETNSSSVHTLTICSGEEYEKWRNEEVLYWRDGDKFGTKEEIIAELKNQSWYSNAKWDDEDYVHDVFSDEGVKTCEEYFDNDWFETFRYTHTTPSGDDIVVFGYYGHD